MVKKSLDIIVSKIDIEPTEKIKSVKVLVIKMNMMNEGTPDVDNIAQAY